MIAIIPAIGESEWFNSLSLKNLAGKSVLAYTLEAAAGSKYIEKTYVITGSKEIATLASSYGAEIFLENYSQQELLTVIKVIQEENGNKTKDFVVLGPANPIRTATDIDAAYEKFLDKGAESLISCSEWDESPNQKKIIINGNVREVLITSNNEEKFYLLNSAIFVFSYRYLIQNGINYSEKSFPYPLAEGHAFEIKSPLDLDFAEFLFLKNNKEVSSIKDNDQYKVLSSLTIRESIKKLDYTGIGFITIVNENNKIMGIVTDGDFRRAVLTGISLDDPIISIANKNFTYLNEGYSREELENIFFNNDIAQVPVLKNNELQEIILRKDIPFIKKNLPEEPALRVPVAIMAGGIGTRLKPFTHVMPKPLIPIGNKPLIELIIDRFQETGINEFYLLINYKANMIKAYFEGRSINNKLQYITEEFPMGTAGALKKLKGTILSTFIVSNCDIIIKSDYKKIVDFHKQGSYDLTLVACMQHFKIPYGICLIEEGGCLKEITEKPEFDYLVNTGMYILEPAILDVIPDNTFYNITDLIEDLKKLNKKIGVFPVYENSWIDVGQWDEYRKALKYLE
jgi:dTDP-glucose pyrophosphorylase/CMP-N-acetylneuraminic acid synthetase